MPGIIGRLRNAASRLGARLAPTAAVRRIPPSQALNLRTVQIKPTVVSLQWTAPKTGSLPFGYTVFYREHGKLAWAVGATSRDPKATIIGLKPLTKYDFEILTHNN